MGGQLAFGKANTGLEDRVRWSRRGSGSGLSIQRGRVGCIGWRWENAPKGIRLFMRGEGFALFLCGSVYTVIGNITTIMRGVLSSGGGLSMETASQARDQKD